MGETRETRGQTKLLTLNSARAKAPLPLPLTALTLSTHHSPLLTPDAQFPIQSSTSVILLLIYFLT